MTRDPDKRPSARDMLQHEWIREHGEAGENEIEPEVMGQGGNLLLWLDYDVASNMQVHEGPLVYGQSSSAHVCTPTAAALLWQLSATITSTALFPTDLFLPAPLSLSQVLHRIKSFATMAKLKQHAALVIARHLPQDQIRGLRVLFDSMDKDHTGAITAEKLRQVGGQACLCLGSMTEVDTCSNHAIGVQEATSIIHAFYLRPHYSLTPAAPHPTQALEDRMNQHHHSVGSSSRGSSLRGFMSSSRSSISSLKGSSSTSSFNSGATHVPPPSKEELQDILEHAVRGEARGSTGCRLGTLQAGAPDFLALHPHAVKPAPSDPSLSSIYPLNPRTFMAVAAWIVPSSWRLSCTRAAWPRRKT